MLRSELKEKIAKWCFAIVSAICIASVVAIFAFLIVKSIPALKQIGLFEFLLGDRWMPDKDATVASPSGQYGVLTMIVSTLCATVGSVLIGGIIGYFTAVFVVYYCPKKLKGVFSAVINLLAGIPSVVYGFFGIAFLLPMLATIAPNNGSGLLAVSIILGLMILPTVVSLSVTALEAVPKTYYEGSLALGADKNVTVFSVMSPAAKSGIAASLVLAIGRALGETMAVIMVSGNSPTYPDGLFSSFRVLTANIALEMGYAGELQQGALIATGVVLLVFSVLVNALFAIVTKKAVSGSLKKRNGKKSQTANISANSGGIADILRKDSLWVRFKRRISESLYIISIKLRLSKVKTGAAFAAGAITAGSLTALLGFICVKGVPELVSNPHLLIGAFEFGSSEITIFPAIITTLWAVAISMIIATPIGIMTAIWLNEYAPKNSVAVKAVRGAISVLGSVPSIVYGLFGMIVFVPITGGTSNILAGSLTISIMLLPTIIKATEESLKAIPEGLREGSYALGGGKLITVLKIALPSALPGILSAVILSIGRVISESAPLLYTMGSVISKTPLSPSDSGATLAVALYRLSGEGWYINEAYGTAVVLIVTVLLINALASVVAKKIKKKLNGEENGQKKL